MSHRINRVVAVPTLMLWSLTALASPNTWNFESDHDNYKVKYDNANYGNTLTVDGDGDGLTDLEITAWADTGCGWNCGKASEIDSAVAWSNSWGLLNYNRDTPNSNYYGEHHYVDNNADTDMMLFSFDESVILNDIRLSYVSSDSDISIAAFNYDPTSVLKGSTWSEIVVTSLFSSSYQNIGTSTYTFPFANSSSVTAQYWLIGAYNKVFGQLNDYTTDYFKISSITTTAAVKEVTEVDAPTSFGVFILASLLILARNQRVEPHLMNCRKILQKHLAYKK